ncbi:GNAT family N-acetyltransferase [Mumia zhuanghuii]|uniref:GNAT family N-acetyltransferase n=2 Tax=Mumia TaxID=1546255 RepID=A0ABW1QKK1_9ACTN|nr:MULTISPECIES: GNAT family N-acetyltransferase [Mumia]KAA1423664.1 GNAT family N-acetyltransferase [Mumia zhuanghuii]
MRSATRADVEAIREIERLADERFRDLGLGFVADGEPTSYEVVAAAVDRGTAWVEVDGVGTPIAFATVDVLDGCAHLEQLSVIPAHGRRGVGTALVGAVEEWALCRGLGVVTLTTFADVPWNAPYYRRLGFEVVPETRWTPGVRERIAEETAFFDPWRRVVMAKALV